MIEIIEEEQERREPKTLEEYVEQMEESEKTRLFDYLKRREGKKMMKITKKEEERGCLFCKRKEIEIRKMSFIDKNGKIVVSMSACYECLKQMREELERKLEE